MDSRSAAAKLATDCQLPLGAAAMISAKMLNFGRNPRHECSAAVFDSQLLDRFIPRIQRIGKISVGIFRVIAGCCALKSLRSDAS